MPITSISSSTTKSRGCLSGFRQLCSLWNRSIFPSDQAKIKSPRGPESTETTRLLSAQSGQDSDSWEKEQETAAHLHDILASYVSEMNAAVDNDVDGQLYENGRSGIHESVSWGDYYGQLVKRTIDGLRTKFSAKCRPDPDVYSRKERTRLVAEATQDINELERQVRQFREVASSVRPMTEDVHNLYVMSIAGQSYRENLRLTAALDRLDETTSSGAPSQDSNTLRTRIELNSLQVEYKFRFHDEPAWEGAEEKPAWIKMLKNWKDEALNVQTEVLQQLSQNIDLKSNNLSAGVGGSRTYGITTPSTKTSVI